jgi:hypothetical protein
MEREVQIIDLVTDLFLQEEYDFVNKIYFDEELQVVVVIVDKLLRIWKYNFVELSGEKIEIIYKVGPRIIEVLGDLEKNPPLTCTWNGQVLGGMAMGTVGLAIYGTAAMSVGAFNYQAGNLTCSVPQAIVTNQHVLNSGGNRIWVCDGAHNIATKDCYIPFSRNDIHVDLQLGRMDSSATNGAGRIIDIGDWNKIDKVNKGIGVKKYGARTGLTSGNVVGIRNIYSQGRLFRHVWQVTSGFSCPGDSGSAVIDSNNNWIGVNTWGDVSDDCTKPGAAYFWAIDTRSQLLKNQIQIKLKRQ